MSKKAKGADPLVDDRPAVIVDELAEVEVQEASFAGMRGKERLEKAYAKVIAAMTEKHAERFRHAPPEDAVQLFQELDEELVLPHGELISKLVYGMKEEQRLTQEDEKAILKIVDAFIKGLKKSEEPG